MKLFAFVLAILMCLGAFAACGSDNGDGKSTDDGNGKDPVDTIYDVGDITVAVPEGWMAFNNTDIHAEESGTLSKRSVNIAKGATSEMEIFIKPYIKIDYHGSDIQMIKPDKSFYDNAVDLTPIKLGSHTWSGFSCESIGYPLVILWAEEGDDQYQVTINCGQGDDAISLEDAEVQRIITSITVKATTDSAESSEDSSADVTGE